MENQMMPKAFLRLLVLSVIMIEPLIPVLASRADVIIYNDIRG